MDNDAHRATLAACHCCGLIQRRPALKRGQRALCWRCATPLSHCPGHGNQAASALAAASLCLYWPAILLPLVEVERLGHQQTASLVQGISSLFAEGQWLIAAVVLVFSLVLPPVKLAALLLLGLRTQTGSARFKAWVYRAVDNIGRWGMLDVLLLAVLVAYVKVGDLLSIRPGSGAAAFVLMVLLSLAAGLVFNPHCLWQEQGRSAS